MEVYEGSFKLQFIVPINCNLNAECRRQNAELLKSFALGKTKMSFRTSEKTTFIVHCALCIVHSQFVGRSPIN